MNIDPRQKFEYQAKGDIACFSMPEYKMKGAFTSYPVPTYEALLNMTKAIYWKPTIDYVIDSVRIMNKIRLITVGQRLIGWRSNSPRRAAYAYLYDVCYQIKGHFIWNEDRPEFTKDRILEKHSECLKTAINQGGRLIPYFGLSECRAFIGPCKFGEGESYYDDMDKMYLGKMEHGFTYPKRDDPDQNIYERFWLVEMKDGVINFPRPEDCQEVTPILKWERKESKTKTSKKTKTA